MCELILTSNAEQDLQRLDPKLRKQVLEKLEWVCENYHKPIHKYWKHNYKKPRFFTLTFRLSYSSESSG